MKKLGIVGIIVLAISAIYLAPKALALALNGEAILEDAINITTTNYSTEISLTQPKNDLLGLYTSVPAVQDVADSLAAQFNGAIEAAAREVGVGIEEVTVEQVKQKLKTTTVDRTGTSAYNAVQGLQRRLAEKIGADPEIWSSEEFVDKMIDKAL